MLIYYRAERICPPHGSLLQYSCSLPCSKSYTKRASKIYYLALNCCNAQQDACQSKVLLMEDTLCDPDGKTSSDCNMLWARIQHLKAMCTGSETLAWSATQSSFHLSFSSQEWPHSQPGQMCELIWGLLKALLEDEGQLSVLFCTCRCLGLSQMLTLLLMHQNQCTTLDQPATSSKTTVLPNMIEYRICSAYNFNCWGWQLKCKDAIPIFQVSFAESTVVV